MSKADWLGGAFVAVLACYALREWVWGERTQAEIDEATARQDTRLAKRPARKPLWLRRLERKWVSVGRLGEQQRRAMP